MIQGAIIEKGHCHLLWDKRMTIDILSGFPLVWIKAGLYLSTIGSH